jgi:hypothetical protein
MVSEHIVSNTGRRERVRSGISGIDEVTNQNKDKRIRLCLLNPHSDKHSKMIPTN